MLSHRKAIIRIGRYLLDTCSHGIVYKPDTTKGLECYVNADFAGGWSQADSDNAENILSCTGYIITYAGCPIIGLVIYKRRLLSALLRQSTLLSLNPYETFFP